jgi:hypothetical protein
VGNLVGDLDEGSLLTDSLEKLSGIRFRQIRRSTRAADIQVPINVSQVQFDPKQMLRVVAELVCDAISRHSPDVEIIGIADYFKSLTVYAFVYLGVVYGIGIDGGMVRLLWKIGLYMDEDSEITPGESYQFVKRLGISGKPPVPIHNFGQPAEFGSW